MVKSTILWTKTTKFTSHFCLICPDQSGDGFAHVFLELQVEKSPIFQLRFELKSENPQFSA